MSLTPISKIIIQIQDRPEWADIRDWGLMIRAWEAAVSPLIASHSRPKSLAGGTLTIATNSTSLAHQLTFGRQALCRQLNEQLGGIPAPITNLRFVSIGYHRDQTLTLTENQSISIDSGEIMTCPHCCCRTRQGELLRWGVCRFCALIP